MPSWLALSLIIVLFFIPTILAAERLARFVTRRNKRREVTVETGKADGRPSGW
ncbi:MAG: hypothetical protein J7493_01480 [Porphyrobacter sp.]|nr:hypothetical protein [Porphyrobacter sp.]